MAILTDLLESSCFGLREAAAGGSTTSEPDQLNEKQTDMACEILKAVFNTIIHATVGQIVGVSPN